MRIHHLNCGTLRPLGGKIVNGDRLPLLPARIVCHCLLIETGDRLVLVDTGVGTHDIDHLKPKLPALGDQHRLQHQFLAKLLLRADLDPETTALHQVKALGHGPDDVTDIVCTHLDWDHAGGLADFPKARVHLDEVEHASAMGEAKNEDSTVQRRRYWTNQWDHGPDWVTYDTGTNESWLGIEGVRELDGLPGLALVRLRGHSPGHCGVRIQTEDGAKPWLLHAADTYFDHREVDPDNPRTTPGLATFQKTLQYDAQARRDSRARVRTIKAEHADEVDTLCTHDPVEFDRYAERAAAPRTAAKA